MGPKQELKQKVCQRYGWSVEFGRIQDGRWTCSVTVGINDRRRFVSDDNASSDPESNVSAVALEGLKEEIARQEAKPVKELVEVFPEQIVVYESNKENWNYFWKNKPSVVGIDVEGNKISPPVLVQIATDEYTIIEAPSVSRGISNNLARLLKDETIVKVFCDNLAHKDKRCLGIMEIPKDLTSGHLVDLEAVTATLLGPVKVARGLSRNVTLSMPELNVLIRKPTKPKERLADVGRFTLIEQGKAPPLQSVWELSEKDLHYAALDAWSTLQAYKRIQKATISAASTAAWALICYMVMQSWDLLLPKWLRIHSPNSLHDTKSMQHPESALLE